MAATSVMPSKYIVFFADQETEIPGSGGAIVKMAAAQIRQQHPATVMISAGTRSGNNMELSGSRFAAVRQALIDHGVREDLIARAPIQGPKLIQTANALDTADQRVEIRLLDKSP